MDPLELELCMVVSRCVGAGNQTLVLSARIASVLNHQAIAPALPAVFEGWEDPPSEKNLHTCRFKELIEFRLCTPGKSLKFLLVRKQTPRKGTCLTTLIH